MKVYTSALAFETALRAREVTIEHVVGIVPGAPSRVYFLGVVLGTDDRIIEVRV